MTDQELQDARLLLARINDDASPLDGDDAGYAAVSIDDLAKLTQVLGPPNTFPMEPTARLRYLASEAGREADRRRPRRRR